VTRPRRHHVQENRAIPLPRRDCCASWKPTKVTVEVPPPRVMGDIAKKARTVGFECPAGHDHKGTCCGQSLPPSRQDERPTKPRPHLQKGRPKSDSVMSMMVPSLGRIRVRSGGQQSRHGSRKLSDRRADEMLASWKPTRSASKVPKPRRTVVLTKSRSRAPP